MSARFSDRLQFPHPLADIRAAAVEAMAVVGAERVEWSGDGTQLSGRVGVSLWSWGEKVHITVGPTGVVRVRSACAFPLQGLDWGKNEDNCRIILGEIARCLTAAPQPELGRISH